MKLEDVVRLLKQGSILQALDLANQWRGSRLGGSLESELLELSDADRRSLVVLLRDVLTEFPQTILGCPVLALRPQADVDTAWLPVLSTDLQPAPSIHFLGWHSCKSDIPILSSETIDSCAPVALGPGVTPLVGLFKSDTDLIPDNFELPPMWLVHSVRAAGVELHLHAASLLDYPSAFEAARIAYGITQNVPATERGLFLSDMAWHRTLRLGIRTALTLKKQPAQESAED